MRPALLAAALASALASQVKIPEAEARANLARLAALYKDKATWEARATRLRKGILKGMDLVPMPRRMGLRAEVFGREDFDGYSVEEVYFESIPGFFVSGNLYRPTAKSDKPRPGVLCPHGHWTDGRVRADMQLRCATLARMGALVFAYDMVGWYENQGSVHHRDDKHVLTYQTWNSMRAVDFLIETGDVDEKRIAITGASGGGTQSFLLTALDPRVAVSVPVVMVSAHFYGGCNCESGRNIHRRDEYGSHTNNAEIAALAAPRPMLLVSCGGDWTKNTPEVEFPHIKRVYDLHGASDRVENAHFADEKHDYGANKRQAVYEFLAKHLQLDRSKLLEDGKVTEAGVTIRKPEELQVFSAGRPAHWLKGSAQVLAALRKLQGPDTEGWPRYGTPKACHEAWYAATNKSDTLGRLGCMSSEARTRQIGHLIYQLDELVRGAGDRAARARALLEKYKIPTAGRDRLPLARNQELLQAKLSRLLVAGMQLDTPRRFAQEAIPLVEADRGSRVSRPVPGIAKTRIHGDRAWLTLDFGPGIQVLQAQQMVREGGSWRVGR